jgi:hypothetical protein
MSKRLTNKWTKTAAKAFGATGAKGDKGELFFVEAYKAKGWNVLHYNSDKVNQLKGIDVVLIDKDGSEYTIDIKNNLKPDGTFYVEINQDGWLFNSKYENNFVSHVNLKTRTVVSYIRQAMQNYIQETYKQTNIDLVCLNANDLNFVTIKKV